jgi:hypothetical protein
LIAAVRVYDVHVEKGARRMALRNFSRRQVAGLVGASAMCAGPAGAMVEGITGSRLSPMVEQPYAPPTNLSGVADIYRRMTVPIRIDGQGPFAFVVDTGANQSVISGELALKLRLPQDASALLNGVAGSQMAPTTIAALGIGGRTKLGAVLSILPAAAIGGAGMLGLDQLEGERLTLDFRDQTLSVEHGGRPWRDPDDITVKAHRRNGQLTLVDAELAGVPIIAFLDSGAQNTIGNLALRNLALARHPTSSRMETLILSATGQTISAQMADLPHLRVGGMGLPNWPVAFADLHTFTMWDLTNKPAILIGVDILTRFESVCLDFARDEVRFRLPKAQVERTFHS